MSKSGRKFEEAVCRFAKTLDPNAEVIFDHNVLDRDTGTPRQCDVWINAKFGGHWPISILVSCKDHKRKLNIGDVGEFANEVHSTSASTGVIYSSSGFTQQAIKKAQSNGLACCRLYQGEPADIPEIIWFESYTCKVRVSLTLKTDLRSSRITTWNDLFDCVAVDEQGEQKVIDILTNVYVDSEKKIVSEVKNTKSFPTDWQNNVTIFNVNGIDEIKFQVFCKWVKYRARQEAHLIKGSYCLSDGSFTGSIFGPPVDTQSEDPGDNWVEINDEEGLLVKNAAIMILYKGDMEAALRNIIGSKPLYQ